jgi:Putative beta barrel porin-7 (BBP7)
MRTLLLTSLSILGGLTTVHAQHWVPYGFHAYKNNQKKSEAQAPAAEQSPVANEQKVVVQQEPSTAPEQQPAAPVAAESSVASQEPVMEKVAVEAIASTGEIDEFYFLDGETAYQDQSVFYSDPDRDYGKPKGKPSNKPEHPRICGQTWWVEGDFLLAWMKKGKLEAPLITTGSAADPFPGAVGQPSTSVFFGNKDYNYHRMPGVKGSIGGFLGVDRDFSFDVEGFFIFSQQKHFNIESDVAGDPLIARPFSDVRLGVNNAEIISEPGSLVGSSHGLIKTQIWGGELNIGYHPCQKNAAENLFIGFRYLRLFEKIRVKDKTTPLTTDSQFFLGSTSGQPVNPPDFIQDKDVFRTNNDFFGGQIGLRGDFALNPWMSLNLAAKVALGVTEEKYKSYGQTTWNSSVYGPQYATGGVLVQPNNMVHQKEWKFSYVPEGSAEFALEFMGIRFLVGYTFMWWSKVVRVGEEIDDHVNSGQIPGNSAYYVPAGQTPNGHLKQTTFWLQYVNFGIAFDF